MVPRPGNSGAEHCLHPVSYTHLYVCTVCGYIAEGEIPAQCPVCKAPASAFVEKTGNTYVTEHVVGIGKAEGVPQEIVDGLRANFEGECSEVGMYLAMEMCIRDRVYLVNIGFQYVITFNKGLYGKYRRNCRKNPCAARVSTTSI